MSVQALLTNLMPIGPKTEAARLSTFVDSFSNELMPGRVIGSSAADGIMRKGIDREGVIGIDNSALRIQPLIRPGWGRAGIAYGPYPRRNGLAFGVFLVNGHNISRTQPFPDGFRMRMRRWMVGSETEKPLRRMIEWVGSDQKRFMWRRLRQWFRLGTGLFPVPPLDENLSVGWFPGEVPADPTKQGSAFTVHAIVPEGGELWARTGSSVLRSVRELQNIPMYYMVVLREKGAAYYAASMPGVSELPAPPYMRLLAIDAFNTDQPVYAGIHQSVLGEIGFRADTRVYHTQIAEVPEFGNWYGSAHGADTLTGRGALHSSTAEVGGAWHVHGGEFDRTERGVIGVGVGSNEALLNLSSPAGLVHLLIDASDKPVESVALIWRAQDKDNFWCFEVASSQCRLFLKENGGWNRFPAVKNCRLLPNAENSVQVSDDGQCIRLYLNGDLVYATAFTDTRFEDGVGVGIRVTGQGGVCVRLFEAHPRKVSIPPSLRFQELWPARGNRIVVNDNFQGPSADLGAHITTLGGKAWRRDIGEGAIEVTGNAAARVVGSPQRPCPGRTAYTIDWVNPAFVDVRVTVTPPAIQKGMKQRGRGGLILWQDPHNYITVNLWHDDDVFSVSSFFRVGGYEELYDAIWTNIGKRIRPGIPYDFGLVFDGSSFHASINDEPVLFRRLTDIYPDWNSFMAHRVGLVANWEWGTDTGSVFQNFVVKDRV
jgi:hypothetical protein